ncbi:MAG: thiol:disulfide interchange protein DsbA/DsbL [Telluria sp.]
MHFFRKLALFALALGFAAAATAAEPKNGVEYLTLTYPQPTDTGKKVEVIEFFAYYCPHCNAFEPLLEAWVKKQGDNIVFKRVHVPHSERVLPQQRMFFTLEAMGLLEQYHQKAFDAMHKDRLPLASDAEVFDWVAKNGIDRAKFENAYRSFGVTARVRKANNMMSAYEIAFWPNLVIDGKYLTSPSQANEGSKERLTETEQQEYALKVMDYLVAKAKAEKK